MIWSVRLKLFESTRCCILWTLEMKTWIHSIVSIIKRTDTDHVLKTGQHLFFTVFMAHAWLLFFDMMPSGQLICFWSDFYCIASTKTHVNSWNTQLVFLHHNPNVVWVMIQPYSTVNRHKVNRHSQTRRTLMTLTQNFRRCCLSRLYYIFYIFIIITINIERASLSESKGNSVSKLFLSNTKNKLKKTKTAKKLFKKRVINNFPSLIEWLMIVVTVVPRLIARRRSRTGGQSTYVVYSMYPCVSIPHSIHPSMLKHT